MSGLLSHKEEGHLLHQTNDIYGRGLGILPERNQGLCIYTASGRGDDFLSIMDIHVCLDSTEPEKFNADAVTKGDSIFLSAGAEGLLQHEMGHVIQQRRENVPATGYVAGQKINDSAVLEREADSLGRRMPQRMVKGVLSAASKGISLQSVQGVVQCSGRGGRRNGRNNRNSGNNRISDAERKLEESIREIIRLRSGGVAEGADQIQEQKRILSGALVVLYPVEEERINRLVNEVARGNYQEISADLKRHLYEGLPISGRQRQREPTGLHAYSNPNRQGVNRGPGVLPDRIKQLGHIGDENQIHILHWKIEGAAKEKFSTMMPRNMNEKVSQIFFGIAKKGGDNTDVDGIQMQKRGDAYFPNAEGVEITGIKRSQVFGDRCDKPDDIITLSDIFTSFNPDEHAVQLRGKLQTLIRLGVYVQHNQ